MVGLDRQEKLVVSILKHQRRQFLCPAEQTIVTTLTILLQLSVCSQAMKQWTKERASGRGDIMMQMHNILRRQRHPKESVHQSRATLTACLSACMPEGQLAASCREVDAGGGPTLSSAVVLLTGGAARELMRYVKRRNHQKLAVL